MQTSWWRCFVEERRRQKMGSGSGRLVVQAHANAGLDVQIAKKPELTRAGNDLDGVAHRTCGFAHAVIPESLALFLACSHEREAHRLRSLLDGHLLGRHDSGGRERQKVDDRAVVR